MWLGHHSPAFTLAVYVHLLPDDLPDPAFLDGITGTSTRDVGNAGETADDSKGVEGARELAL